MINDHLIVFPIKFNTVLTKMKWAGTKSVHIEEQKEIKITIGISCHIVLWITNIFMIFDRMAFSHVMKSLYAPHACNNIRQCKRIIIMSLRSECEYFIRIFLWFYLSLSLEMLNFERERERENESGSKKEKEGGIAKEKKMR